MKTVSRIVCGEIEFFSSSACDKTVNDLMCYHCHFIYFMYLPLLYLLVSSGFSRNFLKVSLWTWTVFNNRTNASESFVFSLLLSRGLFVWMDSWTCFVASVLCSPVLSNCLLAHSFTNISSWNLFSLSYFSSSCFSLACSWQDFISNCWDWAETLVLNSFSFCIRTSFCFWNHIRKHEDI